MEQTNRDRAVLIEGGNVINGNGGSAQRGCSVLIKGRMIAALRQAADTEAQIVVREDD
jgi:hypothetical protein